MDRLKVYSLWSVPMLLLGCNFYDRLSGFDEVPGCYRNEQGHVVMRIDAHGGVTDDRGGPIGSATLDVRPNSSLLEFTPGIRISADHNGIEIADEPTSTFLIGKPRGQVVLTLHDDASEHPGVMLIREAECGGH